MEGAVRVGPAAIVTGHQQFLHLGWQDEFRIGRVFLFEQALGGGVVPVLETVLGAVRQHVTVGEAHGGVGVRVHGLALLPLHEGGGKMLAGGVVLVLGFVGSASGTPAGTGPHGAAVKLFVMCHQRGVSAGNELGHRVLCQLILGRNILGQLFKGSESAGSEEGIHVGGDVHGGKIPSGNLQVIFLGRSLPIELQKRHGLFLVQFHHIVAVHALDAGEDRLQRGVFVALLFQQVGAYYAVVQAHQLNAVGHLGNEGNGTVRGRVAFHVFGDIGHRVSVKGLALRRSLDPGLQGRFLLFFPADDVEVLESQLLTLPLLPAIGAAGILVGILELDGRVCAHGFPHEVLAHGAGVDPDAVGGNHLLELGGRLVALGAAGIAHDHGKVVLLHTAGGNLQAAGGLVGDVFGAVLGREVVLAGIDAEHGEVAGMAGPHPVVGFSAEFTHGCRGSAHEANVTVGAVNDKVVDVVVVEAGYLYAAAGIGVLGGLLQVFGLGAVLFNGVGDVFHAHEEGDGEARAGDFLSQVLGPETIHEVVVLVGGEALDAAVAAVVVGHQEALGRYHLTGATPAEVHDGVFQGSFVDGVNLFRAQAAAGCLEVFAVELLEQRQEPHSFVGHGAHRDGETGTKSEKSFHKQ